uniref:dephospho-CoA kinase n=1 Tax=Globicatella sulfidifaciens TaxID=136093 RepID=UPI0023F508F5|nr:dephospho-CoA kinase [Globicatella sulfidifaciens]
MKKIGITGGIATGKTTVSHYLRQKGYTVVDADEAARAVVAPMSLGIDKVIDAFGHQMVKSDGQLDRELLGSVIFKDEAKRDQLNHLLHPLIMDWMDQQIAKAETEIVFVDVPLLYEVGYDQKVDQVWLVYVNRLTQLQRLMERNHLTEQEANQRIDSQWSLEAKKEKADVVINNEGDLDALYRQIDQLLEEL